MTIMHAMPSQIDLYQEISALSARMVEAAQVQDWERLVALEQSVAALRDILMRDEDNGSLNSGERGIKAALIQRILDDDAEIRRHTEPWMEHVRGYLGNTALQRRVSDAYSGAASSFGGAPR